MRTNLHHLLEEKVPGDAGRPALTDNSVTYTYAEVWAKVRGVANGLRRLGLQRGDRVAVFLDKRIETVAGIFGTSAAGEYSCPSTRYCARPRWPTSCRLRSSRACYARALSRDAAGAKELR